MHTDRTVFVDVGFDGLSTDQLLDRLGQVSAEHRFGYLVTPNVDHIVRLHKGRYAAPELAQIYANAEFCVCDSKILARLASFWGLHLEVIPGSDLTELMFSRVLRDGDRIAIVGGDTGLIEALRGRFPHIDIVHYCAPMGLAANAGARHSAAAFIVEQKARFNFICVGSPQQELIAAEAERIGGACGLSLCVGAALEFMTGRQRRAPGLMRRFGLEWAHRLLANPRRMWRRYLIDGPQIFILAYRWAQKGT